MNVLGLILASQLGAPLVALDLPAVGRLRVGVVEHDDEVTVIHLTRRFLFSGRDDTARITLRGDKLDGVHTTWSLLRGHHGSSGEVGLMLIGLPGLLVSSPLLLLAHGVLYPVARLLTGGMHRYAALTAFKLYWQLPREVRGRLVRALRAV